MGEWGMAAQPGPTPAEEPPARTTPIAKRVFFVVLAGWNLLMLVAVLDELSIRHRPHAQIGANDIVLGVLIDSWIVVNLVIIAAALLFRRWGRRRAQTGRPSQPANSVASAPVDHGR
jgi:hypothetical protein